MYVCDIHNGEKSFREMVGIKHPHVPFETVPGLLKYAVENCGLFFVWCDRVLESQTDRRIH